MQETNHTETPFRAVLRPNRSLSRKGFLILMIVVAGVSFTGGIVFLYIGAWPVFGFLGLDVLLVYWALRKSFIAAEAREIVEVNEHEVVIFRLRPGKAMEELRFPRAWVRVELEEDEERELVGPLTLRFRGRRHEIGMFLGAADRKSFAGALRAALAQPRV